MALKTVQKLQWMLNATTYVVVVASSLKLSGSCFGGYSGCQFVSGNNLKCQFGLLKPFTALDQGNWGTISFQTNATLPPRSPELYNCATTVDEGDSNKEQRFLCGGTDCDIQLRMAPYLETLYWGHTTTRSLRLSSRPWQLDWYTIYEIYQ